MAGRRRSIGRPAAAPRFPAARPSPRSAFPSTRPRDAPATSRSCHRSSRRGRPSESIAPVRMSRSSTSSGSPVRSTTSTRPRYGPCVSSRSSSSSCCSPIPFTRPDPNRTPQPAVTSGVQRSRAAADGTTQAGERIGSGRAAIPAPSGNGSPGRPTHSVVVLYEDALTSTGRTETPWRFASLTRTSTG